MRRRMIRTINLPARAEANETGAMKQAGRLWMFVVTMPVLAWLLLRAMLDLPGFGHYPGPYGTILNHVAYYQRHLTNIVTAINFDYRGLDTLGEEFILFAAVAGVIVLLRGEPGEGDADPEQPTAAGRPDLPRSDDSAWMSAGFLGLILVFGIYVILHGQLTPGGGFQGGTITGTAFLLIYVTRNYKAFRNTSPKEASDAVEAIAAGAYALVGIAALATGAAFLQNILPLGKTGNLLSSGTVFVINLFVGIEVAAGFTVIFLEFTEEVRDRQKQHKS
jgi:multicomponent Na+:H+ antiporter subunit B